APAVEFEPNIDAAALATHLSVLAHDSMFGRRAGSEYELRAAKYIRDEFMEYG
ncbi:MAG: peptidase M28, partial [Gemmatimonadetes bacterium]|nr:peptidase M28 [Gemmatimonadota bacterium]